VVIEDRVELGAFVAVDRATLGTTYIRTGTKMDNFCHIAHNCDLGAHSLTAGGFMTAGSCKIGHHFVAGGAVHVGDHVNVPPQVTLAGRTGLTGNIEEPGVYGGFPVQPIKEYLKNMSNQRQLTGMRKSIEMILKHLGLNESK
jgi:UDP-3-O-[3-hydroxymyristoyl] glucosamine N-acyltransferase